MRCKYCFAQFKNVQEKISDIEIFAMIKMLKEYGFTKINFVGGEPFLIEGLDLLLEYAKRIGFYTSIVTNGSLITDSFLRKNYIYIDQIGVSIDSLHKVTNELIGRANESRIFDERFYSQVLSLINNYPISLKINTVASALNLKENIANIVNQFDIERWKIFQVLSVKNENDTYYKDFQISRSEFREFCEQQYNHLQEWKRNVLIQENDDIIRGSYIMINPEGKFFDNTKGYYTVSDKIINIGVEQALKEIKYDFDKFIKRDGDYFTKSKIKRAI
jgi:radical S-adenosyl methionine domain-containing protein 2